MFIQPSQGSGGTAGQVETVPSVLTPAQVLERKQAKRLDSTSTPGTLYIGAAAIGAEESAAVWVLGRWDGSALEYAQAPAAWADHLTVAYGV